MPHLSPVPDASPRSFAASFERWTAAAVNSAIAGSAGITASTDNAVAVKSCAGLHGGGSDQRRRMRGSGVVHEPGSFVARNEETAVRDAQSLALCWGHR
jgi:hypothetical protein